MEGGEGPSEDPFGFLINLCKPMPSQEEELRNCPFARESEAFPDSISSRDTDWSWPETWTPSQPTEIMRVSPPRSDSKNDDPHTSLDDDRFLTPPEHLHSHTSDSDDPRVPPLSDQPPSAFVCGGTGVSDDMETVRTVDLGRDEDYGEEGHLGLEVCGDDLAGERCDLEGQIVPKTIRVLEEDSLGGLSCPRTESVDDLDTKIIEPDPEECVEIQMNKEKQAISLDFPERLLNGEDKFSEENNLRGNGADGVEVSGHTEGERMSLGGDEDGGGLCDSRSLIETGEDGDGINVHENWGIKGTTYVDVRRKEKVCIDGEGSSGSGEGTNVCQSGRRGYVVSRDQEMKDISGGSVVCEDANLSENGRGGYRNDELTNSGNGDGEIRKDGNLQRNIMSGLYKAINNIERSKNASSGDGMHQRGKDGCTLGKRSCPGVEVEDRRDETKSEFLKDILTASKLFIKDEDDDSEVDYFETAKRRGLIPRPRWWPDDFK